MAVTNAKSVYSTFPNGVTTRQVQLNAKRAPPVQKNVAAESTFDTFMAVLWVSIWLISGILITIFLKKLSSPEIGFQFMSTLTLLHFTCQSLFLRSVFACTSIFGELQAMQGQHRAAIVGVGLYTGLDIVLTNISFNYVSLGCQTMLKSLSPLAVYFVACWWGVERWKNSLLLVIVVVCGSCAITVTDVHASASGVIMLLSAVVFAACRWVSIQALCGSYKSVQLMAFSQPFAALTVLPYVLCFEAPLWSTAKSLPFVGYLYAFATIVCSISLVLSMFKITEYTSATTLGVLGNGRGVFLIFYGAVILGESKTYSLLGWLGIIGNVVGIFIYGHLRRTHTDQEKLRISSGKQTSKTFFQIARQNEAGQSEMARGQPKSQRVD